MTLSPPELLVYRVDNTEFTALGSISQYTSLTWPDKYNGYDSFELYAPVTDHNRDLLQKGYILYIKKRNACIVEIIDSEFDEEGKRTYLIKGRTIEALLESRIIWNPYSCTNKYISTIMYDIVNENCVNPTNSSRKIPYLYCAKDTFIGNKIEYQESDSTVYKALVDLSQEQEIGFTIDFLPENKKLQFRVYQGDDLSKYSDSNCILLSTTMEDILSSDYYLNIQAEKNVALVAGEGTGSKRKKISVGESNSQGFNRKELYVDARDLQSTVYKEDGSEQTLTESEYLSSLTTRGLNSLAKCSIAQTFEAQIRTIGGQYSFGIDYNNGDKILMQDAVLGIQVAGRITNVVYTYGKTNRLTLTFGYSQPSLVERIKQSM